jgi:1,4-alpha-glucan branching enzyme
VFVLRKEPSKASGQVLVTFEYPAATKAEQVNLVGDFNDWNEKATPMTRSPHDRVWRVQVRLEKGRSFRFRYLVDQYTWHNDWHADDYVPNIHGSDDSVVVT